MPNTLTIRGGGRTQRLIVRSQQLTGAVIAKLAVDVLREELLPALKSRVPRRTGKLANSLRIERRDEEVRLVGVFYANLVNRGQRDSVARIAMDLLEENRERIRDAIAARVRQFLGV